ncbi:hypothetical protein Ndes2526B_g08016 [Nannochloris sp. 'desiccata']|nr:hypothetical protein KSW81_002659 [Chlorella desiccata (nom. nud.)]
MVKSNKNKKGKFSNKGNPSYRDLKKAMQLVKDVIAESHFVRIRNSRLKAENDVLIKTITALQAVSRPVEEFQHHLDVIGEDHVPFLDSQQSKQQQKQLQLVGGVYGHGSWDGDLPQDSFNMYDAEMHDNAIEIVDNDVDHEYLCKGLSSLEEEEHQLCCFLQGNGGSAAAAADVAAAATIATLSM